ncbi:MAG: lytic murein transglycosylase [Candidatus Cloacimonetes bacterium]|nr:lytic murein transglycosylase [Candidatus Cloacimonadota bacterium]
MLFIVGLMGPENSEEFFVEYAPKLTELASRLEERGIPKEWFWEQIERENFQFHANMENYFLNMAEHRFDRGEITVTDYKQHFGVERKIRLGRIFIEENKELLSQIKTRNGIDYEIMVAILGMETNFAEQRQRGNFYVFDALVSQYLLIPRRENYAVNQFVALYIFMDKINRDTDYFIGSFAGASGWGQFIPASLNSFFISFDGVDEHIDIFSIEDNLASIENYLHQHGLRESTMQSEQHRRNAVFAYNRNEAYVQAVLYIYEELKRTCF